MMDSDGLVSPCGYWIHWNVILFFFSQSNTLQNISLLMTIVGQTIPSSHSHETMQDRCWNNRLFLCLLLGERQGYLETVRSRLVVSGY